MDELRKIVELTPEVYNIVNKNNIQKINLHESLNGLYVNFYPYDGKLYCDDILNAARNENYIIDFFSIILFYKIYSYKPYTKQSLINMFVEKTYYEFRKMIVTNVGAKFNINKNEYINIVSKLIDNTIECRNSTYGCNNEAKHNTEYKEFITQYLNYIKYINTRYNINININTL